MIHDLPTLERPREKLLHFGVGSLSNSELLAILLSSGSKSDSAISLASKVLSLEKYSLKNLNNYEAEEFMKLKGIGVAKACTLVAAIELGRRIAASPKEDRALMDETKDLVALFMERMRYSNKEMVKIAMLDLHRKLIGISDISVGDIGKAAANPREVFAPAIRKGAAAIVVCHNHPSGDCTPSDSDFECTRILVQSGLILGIQVLDHIVIGDNCYVSIKDVNSSIFS